MGLTCISIALFLAMLCMRAETRVGLPCTSKNECWCDECCVFDRSEAKTQKQSFNKTQGICKRLKFLNEECLLDQSKRLERNIAYDCPCGKGYTCESVGATERRFFYIGKKKLKSGIGLCKPQFCVNTNDCGQTQCCLRVFGVKLPYLSKNPRQDRKAVGKCTELSKERQVCLKSANIRNNRASYDQYCPCMRDLICDDVSASLPIGVGIPIGFNPITKGRFGECKRYTCAKQRDCAKDECCVLDKREYERTGIVPEFGTCRQLGKCGEACTVGTLKPLQETKPMFIDCPCKEQQYTCRPQNPNITDTLGALGTCQKWSEEEKEQRRLEEERKKLRNELENKAGPGLYPAEVGV
ncbi:unnamed protein product [Owenia fusiformis]|nr:unnamed protein product [Owenia fusiformis]